MINASTPLFHLLLPVVGFCVGIFGSFTGLGGSIILTPTLAVVFGLPYDKAVTCALAQLVGMSMAGLVRHYRLGHVDLRLAGNFLAGSLPGAVLGRLMLQWISGTWGMEGGVRIAFHVFYGVSLAAGTGAMLVKLTRFLRHRDEERPAGAHRTRLSGRASKGSVLLLGGLAAGFLAGLLAIGGGIVTVPVLAGFLGVPVVTAVGTSVFQMVFSASAATFVSMKSGELDWAIVGLLLAGSIPGALIGPWLLNRAAARFSGSTLNQTEPVE